MKRTDKQLEELSKKILLKIKTLTVVPELTDEDVEALELFAVFRVLRSELNK